MQKTARQRTPWIFLSLGSVLFIVAASLLLYQSRETKGTPAIEVTPQRIEYGDVTYNTPLKFSITVTNKGDGLLRFTEAPSIEVLEGC